MNQNGRANQSKIVSFEFNGDASEYFKIWIINLALTLPTFGIYSAWAKVRQTRYLYGSTSLQGSGFVYLANPKSILRGRIIAAVLLVIWFVVFQWGSILSIQWSVYIAVVAYGLAILLSPFLIHAALRFRLANTWFHGMRFSFTGTARESFVAYGFWLLIGVITAGLLYPIYVHKRIRYLVDHTQYGNEKFKFTGGVSTLYGIYLQMALLIFIPVTVLSAFITQMYPNLVDIVLSNVFYNATRELPSTNDLIIKVFSGYIVFFLLMACVLGFLRARITNYTLNHLTIKNSRFLGNMSALTLIWIYFTNFLAVALSFGLLAPWARVRATRYRVSHAKVLLNDDLDGLFDGENLQHAAFGEEAAGFFDVDVGL